MAKLLSWSEKATRVLGTQECERSEPVRYSPVKDGVSDLSVKQLQKYNKGSAIRPKKTVSRMGCELTWESVGCYTANGEKLSDSQSEPGQAIASAAA